MNWIAFFSQTGTEIVELTKLLGRKPDLLVTNNSEVTIPYSVELRKLGVPIQSANHDLLMNYFRHQTLYAIPETLISLHGYLRILPADICEQYEIYNGHPGAIGLYPELKGLDPQARAWENCERYSRIGSVVHKVTAGVDEGEIVSEVTVPNLVKSLDEMYGTLKQTSLQSWIKFMEDRL